jgi:hypothetical protein
MPASFVYMRKKFWKRDRRQRLRSRRCIVHAFLGLDGLVQAVAPAAAVHRGGR